MQILYDQLNKGKNKSTTRETNANISSQKIFSRLFSYIQSFRILLTRNFQKYLLFHEALILFDLIVSETFNERVTQTISKLIVGFSARTLKLLNYKGNKYAYLHVSICLSPCCVATHDLFFNKNLYWLDFSVLKNNYLPYSNFRK